MAAILQREPTQPRLAGVPVQRHQRHALSTHLRLHLFLRVSKWIFPKRLIINTLSCIARAVPSQPRCLKHLKHLKYSKCTYSEMAIANLDLNA